MDPTDLENSLPGFTFSPLAAQALPWRATALRQNMLISKIL